MLTQDGALLGCPGWVSEYPAWSDDQGDLPCQPYCLWMPWVSGGSSLHDCGSDIAPAKEDIFTCVIDLCLDSSLVEWITHKRCIESQSCFASVHWY